MIVIEGLHKSFDSHSVLKGVEFHIDRGDSAAIIGRSGCGKSVLLKLIIGLIRPDRGEVRIGGKIINDLSERELMTIRRKFGMVFQGAALFDSLTVAENIGFVLSREKTLTPGAISRKVDQALEMVELHGTRDKKPAELSGGMRKRVGLARALVYEPEIILYDEPTTGLDPVVADSIDKLIQKVSRQLEITSVAVTHDMRTAGRVGQKILMLHNGIIYIQGDADKLFKSTDPVVHRFVNGISDPKDATFKN
ncbi:MAG TPA: ATP-binding cassette domain-containing protein [Verrucomicrobiales bacterium]|nr:ATP-binding cassette domain-containing protein [Verrucomicrobiales bacterium]